MISNGLVNALMAAFPLDLQGSSLLYNNLILLSLAQSFASVLVEAPDWDHKDLVVDDHTEEEKEESKQLEQGEVLDLFPEDRHDHEEDPHQGDSRNLNR